MGINVCGGGDGVLWGDCVVTCGSMEMTVVRLPWLVML